MNRSSRRPPILARMCLLAGILVATPTGARAHSFEPALLGLTETAPGRFAVTWRLPGRESGSLPAAAAPAPRFPPWCRPLDAAVAATAVTEATTEGPRSWTLDCGPQGLHGAAVGVAGIAGSRLDVFVRVAWRDGTVETAVLRSGADEFRIPPSPASRGVAAGAPLAVLLRAYVRLGIEHIFRGADHLAFVLALFLLVETRRMLLKTITAFTLAHSLTLALATLEWIRLPAAPVEALIALSIVLVAREVVRPPVSPASLAAEQPWLPALLFGLLHGLGFAGALSEFGLPADAVPLALGGFNVGVEIGQLAFVALVSLVARIAANRFAQVGRARRACAYALGALGCAWVIDRIAGFWA